MAFSDMRMTCYGMIDKCAKNPLIPDTYIFPLCYAIKQEIFIDSKARSQQSGININMVGRTLINVAIIGGGPGGLGTAITLSQLPFVQVTLYEKNPEPREAGAGISLSTNAWKVLDLLGASDGVKGGSKSNTHQRYVETFEM
jgi:NADPH-dependent 2,4-dienoyl-CoA reductase/sulfur reductase-like enzyme